MERKQENLYKYEVYCPVCGATWKRKTRCKLVRDPIYSTAKDVR